MSDNGCYKLLENSVDSLTRAAQHLANLKVETDSVFVGGVRLSSVLDSIQTAYVESAIEDIRKYLKFHPQEEKKE